MAEKILVGPVNKGLRTDRLPFVIDNDSFPQIINGYQWRGRVKRKRGTSLLGQLNRWIGTTAGGAASPQILPAPDNGVISVTIGDNIYTDTGAGYGVNFLTAGSGTVSLAVDGTLTIAGSDAAEQIFYYPHLPVMGLEDLILSANDNQGTIAFDTTYSYNITTTSPVSIYDVSYFKNPLTGPGSYVAKAKPASLFWNGEDYQQFWTANYQGALWATNGVQVPFNPSNIGMQFNTITAVTIDVGGPPATVTITTGTNHGLIIGDFVYLNEIEGMTGINFQAGYVTAVPAVNQITVELPSATVAGVWASGGIVQYLTNRIDTTIDCIRWYDGDPTNGTFPPTFTTGKGWVNYCPPLSMEDFSIADLPLDQYYLVGCKMLQPFKDRMVFFGPVVQSSTGSPIYLQDTIIYTQNGTPYYTSSFTGDPTAVTTTFTPILVPTNQTATAPALFEDQVGFGGFISVGTTESIITIGDNEDALLVGFNTFQTRLLATGSDTVPFEFFIVNSELGSASTFSSISLDQGVLTRGTRGFILTTQTSSARFDLEVLDQVFDIKVLSNGNERFTAYRDFINEWIYFTYNADSSKWRYPNRTLFYNYRDESFGVFNESYTTYGQYIATTGKTWPQYTDVTWENWHDTWESGENDATQAKVIAGNQQGFVLMRSEDSTSEGVSLYIQNYSNGLVTCPQHNLNSGDWIIIQDAQGTDVNLLNGIPFKVASPGENSFTITPIPSGVTYTGGGYIKRCYKPFIQTKQFPLAWDMSRKTRLGPQQYLFTTTPSGQVTVNIYLSQDGSTEFNFGEIPPEPNPLNGSLIYSQRVYTCPESTNLGLTPFNTNLNMLVQPGATAGANASTSSQQIWHRMNTSLIGDTVQLAFTLSDEQMADENLVLQFAEIELHAFILEVSSAGLLA